MRSIIAAGVLLLLSFLPTPAPAAGQELDPYGRIDPVATSVSVVRRSVGPDGSPAVLTALADAAPPEIDRLLEAMLDHPDPAMRTAAAVELTRRGTGDPPRLVARLGADDARAAFVVALLGESRLDPALAATLLDRSLAGEAPVATAILASVAGREGDLDRLATIAADPTAAPLARGIAAGRLEDTRAGSVGAWRDTLGTLPPDAAEVAIFGTVAALENLRATAGLRALERFEASRPADDAIRASIVLALLRLDPTAGTEAWTRLAAESGDRTIPTALLLVSAERPLPKSAIASLPEGDALRQAVRALLVATPAERLPVSVAAVREGHLPTIRWLLDLPADRLPPEVLDAMIETALSRRRTAMIEVLLDAATRLAAVAPERVADRLATAIASKDEVAIEAMLRGLIAAGSPGAAEAASAWLQAPDRRTRSLALLAVACGRGLEGASVRRLGLAAAGGGDLPDDLRPLAAWHHLLLEQRTDDALDGLVDG